MARNQIVQWVLLPAGLTSDGQLAASLYISPRLRSDEGSTLADFPDFVDWPQLLRARLDITLQRGDGTTEAPMQTMVSASSKLWQALFPPTTPVRPFEFDDYADRPIVTYPVRKVLDHLQDRWASLAIRAIDDLPLSTSNVSPIGPTIDIENPRGPILAAHFDALRDANRVGILEGVEDAQDFSNRLEATLRGAAARAAALRAAHNLMLQPMIEPFAVSDSTAGNFYRVMGFHRRPLKEPADFPSQQGEAAAELQQKMEFHHLLSSLGDHPALLRALGLVIDLIVRPDFVSVTLDQDPPVSLRALVQRDSAFPPRGDPAQSPWNVDVMPWTLARLTEVEGQGFFSAAERPGPSRRFAHGFLRMDATRLAAIAVDVDGLALKTLGMAATLTKQEEETQRPIEEPAEAGVPTPRTGGVALVLTEHGQELHRDFYQARANDDALGSLDPEKPPTLAAEDFVRGYRMDVFDGASGTWRSLQQRVAKYTPLRDPTTEMIAEDEGTGQLSLTGEVSRPNTPADPDGALYAHEALITWDGWSLAAKRPGRAIPQEPAVPAAAVDLGALQLGIDVTARPASLPPLRFGRRYRLRVRTVDLAGIAHGLVQADNLARILDGTGDPNYVVSLPPDPLVYRRFEPVPPPELVPRKRFAPGEGLERLVVRSNFDRSSQDYAQASQAAAEESLRFFPFCDRHVAPAKASLQLAELHGMFDEALDAVQGLSHADATAAIQRFHEIASRESGSFRDAPGAQFVATGIHQEQPQGYVVIDANEIDLPYLPDPFCGGAVVRLRLEPGAPEVEHVIEFHSRGGWHQRDPVSLRLEEGSPPSAEFVDPSHRQFVVRLPRGRTARMRINSLMAGDPELFGVLDWCRLKLSADEAEEVATAIRKSRHWMTTPWRMIELVHAVQQPLEEPILSLELERAPAFHRRRDDTTARLFGRISLDVPSTAQIDLVADWQDVVDDPATGLLNVDDMVRPVHTNVFTVLLPEPFGTPWSSEIEFLLAIKSERDIVFHTESREQESPEIVRRRLLSDAAMPGLLVQERNRLSAAAAHIEKLRAHDFGDAKYRQVRYRLIASTRFREYFDPLMPAADGQRLGNVQTVEMLSSAAPPVPSIIDVVPILRWEEEGTLATGRTSTRRGLGLRVWLKRPWFASGAGEMLGLVCRNDGMVGTNSAGYREVTYIARDPVHGGILPLPLSSEGVIGANLTLREVQVRTDSGLANVSLAAFNPQYDKDRDAWYCDIRFDTGTAYYPFVRLGLIRYQPMSISGCQCSPIAATYFVQTLPERSLILTTQGETLRLRLRGPAPSNRLDVSGAVVAGTNLVVALVEEHDPLVSDPDIGWTPAATEVPLAAELGADGIAVWSGDVPLPRGAGGPRRLRVCEYELHPADQRNAGAQVTLTEVRRLVHADVIALDA